MIKIGIVGASGRMGSELVKIATHSVFTHQFILVGASVRDNNPLLGQKITNHQTGKSLDIKYSSDLHKILKEAEVIIDFTNPTYSLEIAQMAAEYGTKHICGTTGFTAQELRFLEQIASKTVIFWSPNMSIGVYVLKVLAARAATILGDSFDIEILEMHHRNKIDAPSGTALMLGEAIAAAQRASLNELKVLGRCGNDHPHIKRTAGSIGFSALRGGGVVGEHSVILASNDEKIELKHTMYNRSNYAENAFKIALWLQSQKPNTLYTMEDYVLSIVT